MEQKTQFNVQLEDAHKNVNNLQTKITEMQMKIEKLEQELSAKTWNVESKLCCLVLSFNVKANRTDFLLKGLQGELCAAQKDDEYVRKKLKLLEEEKTVLRKRYDDNEDELKRKYGGLKQTSFFLFLF